MSFKEKAGELNVAKIGKSKVHGNLKLRTARSEENLIKIFLVFFHVKQ